LVFRCTPFAKMLVANSNGSKVKSTDCKINASTRKETFTLSQVLFYLLKIDKFTNVCIPSLPSLIDHTCIPYFPVKSDETIARVDSLSV